MENSGKNYRVGAMDRAVRSAWCWAVGENRAVRAVVAPAAAAEIIGPPVKLIYDADLLSIGREDNK